MSTIDPEKKKEMIGKITEMPSNIRPTTTSKKSEVSTIVSNNKIHFVSFCMMCIIYFLFFCIFLLFYNMILTRQILLSIPHDLHDFLSEFQNISGYATHKTIIDTILFKYRIASFFIVSLFIISTNLIIYVYVCNGTQISYAIRVIIECILITLLPMYVLCNNVSVVKMFENSIGYFVVKNIYRVDGTSFSTFMNSFFIHTDYENVDFTFLFTMFQLSNFGDMLNTFYMNKNANFHFASDTTEANLHHLLSAVVCKNSIGHICWIFFTSIITTFLIYI
jgi:hypothetical protein